ncbi:MAG: hypothetical protein IJ358_01975, partial [Clostridia bacterium]|nr:hypothetical protein [Clostridia bacterium]
MCKSKKIILSLSIFFAMLISLVIGIAQQNTPANTTNPAIKRGGYIIEQGSSKLELNYVPDVKILAGSAAPDISGDTTTEEIVIEDDV